MYLFLFVPFNTELCHQRDSIMACLQSLRLHNKVPRFGCLEIRPASLALSLRFHLRWLRWSGWRQGLLSRPRVFPSHLPSQLPPQSQAASEPLILPVTTDFPRTLFSRTTPESVLFAVFWVSQNKKAGIDVGGFQTEWP